MAVNEQSPRTNGDDQREIRLLFPASTYRVLEELAQRTGRSIPQILADAIALEKFVQDARREQYRVLLERNGKYEEVRLSA